MTPGGWVILYAVGWVSTAVLIADFEARFVGYFRQSFRPTWRDWAAATFFGVTLATVWPVAGPVYLAMRRD